MTRKLQLEFGLNAVLPEWVVTAWGARLIYPNDLLQNRQSMFGRETDKQLLVDWLNAGALRDALYNAGQLHMKRKMTPIDHHEFTLYEDATGIIVGNPNASHGYLYVAAWFKQKGTK